MPYDTATPGEAEAAAYIAGLARDLRDIAERSGLRTLRYLLDMARLEAEREVKVRETTQPR